MAEETNQLRVRLVTPERTLFEGVAESVELPSKSGELEVMYGHAPTMSELGSGDVILRGAEVNQAGLLQFNVNWGFVEVLGDRVTILANDALKPEEIDVERAEEQLARGEKMAREGDDSLEAWDEADRVIREAEAKLATAAEVRK